MKYLNKWLEKTKVKVIVLLPFYLFTFLSLNAQVGTWQNHLAYHQVQSICKAGDELFILARMISTSIT